MRVLFHNPIPLVIKFKTLINPQSPLKSPRFLRHFGFFSWFSSSGSCNSSLNNTKIVAETPMATAVPNPSSPITAMHDGSGIAKKCWIKFWKESTLSLYTPFVVCLASGTLNLDTFRHYIAQDIHFLKAFAKAYELAEVFADDDDAKIGINEMRKNVVEELKMHSSVVQEWGIDVAKETTPNPATVKYTEFLLATASGKVEGLKDPGKLATPFEKTKIAAYTLAAVTPCMKLYAFLGEEMVNLLGDNDGYSSHPYKKWIDCYSSKHFQAAALETEELLDKLSVSLTGEELGVIEQLYHQGMKLELEFFLAQPVVQKTVIPLSKELRKTGDHLVIFSDFDLTCTVLDSSAILAEIAIRSAPKSDQNEPENQVARMSSADIARMSSVDLNAPENQIARMSSVNLNEPENQSACMSSADLNEPENKIARMSSDDLKKMWEGISYKYTEEHEKCIKNILLTNKAKNFEYEGLRKALEQLSDFEKNANLRVIDSGVLKGLNLEDIKRTGECLIFRNGCKNFFQSLIKNENLRVDIHVLSYCWCADLIRTAFSSDGLDVLRIYANEFMYEDGLSTGNFDRKMESPIDKIQAFSNILQNSSNEKRNLTVYIGDSVGDLLCLLEADIGIVIDSSPSPSLRLVGTHFGVTFVPLSTAIIEKQKRFVEENSYPWKRLSGILYTITSWSEIHAFILGW